MLELIKKWYPEDDPITRDQVQTLILMLDGLLTEKALEGFLIVCSRLVDEFGNHRTGELSKVFRTQRPEGKRALVRSLEFVNEWVGGMDAYLRLYSVTLDPPNPAFPQFKIIGIETLEACLYRIMDSTGLVHNSNESIKGYIRRTGRLTDVPVQTVPVLRSKPLYHWSSYEKWDTPELAREAFQILPEWRNNCQLRATILTSNVANSSFVAFNGDKDSKWHFTGYFFEPLAQDHPSWTGGGIQIGLDGAPLVETLEEWDESGKSWMMLWPVPK